VPSRRTTAASATLLLAALVAASLLHASPTHAQGEVPLPHLTLGLQKAEKPPDVAMTLKIVFILAVLSLAPALLMMLTSFTRIIIILSFLRSALGTQQMPPNSVLAGFALFLTLFIMLPTYNEIDRTALKPYLAGAITFQEATQRAAVPLRTFMLKQTRERDLALFVRMANLPPLQGPQDIPMHVLIPAFISSELKTAFQVGFVIYIPFLIIDLVIASMLMSMGMLMLPPVMISLPFKILLFVMVDGWYLLTRSIVVSFT
jgi:flagellar biosynthetic protein FliP